MHMRRRIPFLKIAPLHTKLSKLRLAKPQLFFAHVVHMTAVVRQQWNFSPPGSIREAEEYQVQLSDITVLELIIKPNISWGDARASLKNLRLS